MFIKEYIYLLVVFEVLLIVETEKQHDAKVIFMDIKCEKLSSKFKSVNCNTTYENHTSSINFLVEPNEDVLQLIVNIKCKLIPENQRSYELLNTKLDICETILNDNSKRGIMKILLKVGKQKAVNMANGCPFKAHVVFGVLDFSIDVASLGFFKPEVNFTLNVDWLTGTEKFATAKVYGAFCQKQKFCEQYYV